MTLSGYEALAIGVSAGGMNALTAILPALPTGFAAAVIVVQHLHPSSDLFLVDHFSRLCRLPVLPVEEKETIVPGNIYFAPANYHVLIERDRTFALSVDRRVRFARPSIDVLFESAAIVYGPRLVGIVLTGANDDGAAGLAAIKRYGGFTVVESPESAEVPVMPRAAMAGTSVDRILTLQEIAGMLSSGFGDRPAGTETEKEG